MRLPVSVTKGNSHKGPHLRVGDSSAWHKAAHPCRLAGVSKGPGTPVDGSQQTRHAATGHAADLPEFPIPMAASGTRPACRAGCRDSI